MQTSLSFRLQRAITRHGLAGLIRESLARGNRLLRLLSPSVSRKQRLRRRRDREFDLYFGVETAGQIPAASVSGERKSALHSSPYRGSDPLVFNKVLQTLPIRHHDFAFIDFGSGKGRALILAAQFPFRSVTGVEFSPELHEIARRNLAKLRPKRRRCLKIECVHLNAMNYVLPDEPLVCYFNNPFDAAVMEPVVEILRSSYSSHPRPIVIAYYNPKEASLFSKAAWLREYFVLENVRVWITNEVG